MAIFIDTANVEEIKEVMSWGVISGATTNPKIMSMEKPGYSFKERIKEIVNIVNGPVSVELTEEELGPMIKQAEEFSAWDKKHIVIKVPMSGVGLKVTTILEKEHGIRVNITAVMNFSQAYLACLAEATYVSIFYGRIKDMGYNPIDTISKTRQAIDNEKLSSKIIVGSIRHFMDANDALSAGAHIITISPLILEKMSRNLMTESTITEFNNIWKKMKQENKIV